MACPRSHSYLATHGVATKAGSLGSDCGFLHCSTELTLCRWDLGDTALRSSPSQRVLSSKLPFGDPSHVFLPLPPFSALLVVWTNPQ